jgi:pilus assembly protein Flp/PilA
MLGLYVDLYSRWVWARDRVETAYRRVTEERGAAGVEYGILVAAIAAVIIAVVFVIGTKVKNAFETVNGKLP